MNKHDSMGDRMKAYENCYRFYLPKRQAVIVRLDGRAFHTFTKDFNRPYDRLFARCMWETARKLCEKVGGCVFAYTQSDEISLVLVDYKNINTEPWFDNNLQKIVSVAASMASIFFKEAIEDCVHDIRYSWSAIDWNSEEEMKANYNFLNELYGTPVDREKFDKYSTTIQEACYNKLAVFDARAFILPREEVINYVYWRQTDCVRNSIQLAGQAYFSHKQLQNKSCDEIQEMLWQEHQVNWSKYPTWFKNGVALYKKPQEVKWTSTDKVKNVVITRDKWFIDLDTPMFSTCPERINKLVIFEE